MLRFICNDFKKRVCNERGTFVYSAIGWLAAGAITWWGISAYQSGQEAKHQAGVQKTKEEEQKKLMEDLAKSKEPVPTGASAQETAHAEMQRKRRMAALHGGKTLLTSESPTLGGGGKTLLGS